MIEARLLGGDVISLINFSNDTEVGWMPFVHCPRTLNELKNLLEDLPKEAFRIAVGREGMVCSSKFSSEN